MSKFTSYFIVLAFCLLSFTGTAYAQNSDGGSWKLSFTENQHEGPSKKGTMTFPTKESAEAWQKSVQGIVLLGTGGKKAWTDFTLTYLGVPDVVLDANKTVSQLREKYDEAQKYIEMAEDAKQNGLTAAFAKQIKERKFGDMLTEYKNLLKGIYEDTFKVREKLIKTKDKLERGTLDQINRQIESYNKQAEVYNQLLTNTDTGSVLRKEGNGITATDITAGGQRANLITPVKPSDLQAEVEGKPIGFTASELEGRQGTGTIGDNKITMDFGKDNQLKIGGELEAQGKWNHRRTHVILETSTWLYLGEIDGDTISGTMHNKDGSQKSVVWKVTIGTSGESKNPLKYLGKVWKEVGGGTANNKWEKYYILRPNGLLERREISSTIPKGETQWKVLDDKSSKGEWTVEGDKVRLKYDAYGDGKLSEFVGAVGNDGTGILRGRFYVLFQDKSWPITMYPGEMPK